METPSVRQPGVHFPVRACAFCLQHGEGHPSELPRPSKTHSWQLLVAIVAASFALKLLPVASQRGLFGDLFSATHIHIAVPSSLSVQAAGSCALKLVYFVGRFLFFYLSQTTAVRAGCDLQAQCSSRQGNTRHIMNPTKPEAVELARIARAVNAGAGDIYRVPCTFLTNRREKNARDFASPSPAMHSC